MAIKLGEFLHNLIKKAGQNPDAEPIKNFFLFPALADIDVPDELVTGLDNNLLSVADATNNHPKIKGHYDKQILDGLDKEIAAILATVEDDEVKQSVLAERSTYKRVPLLVSKIKELEAKKLAATSKPDKDAIQEQKAAYQKQLEDLQFKLKTAEADKNKIKDDFDKQVLNIKIESKINSMLSGYKTIYDDLNPDVRGAAINALMNKELSDTQAEFFFDEKGVFDLRQKDGANYLGDNHQKIQPQAFIEQLLSRNKLLKVTTTQDSTQSDNTNNANGFNALAGAPATANGTAKPQRNLLLKELARNSMNDMKSNADAPVM